MYSTMDIGYSLSQAMAKKRIKGSELSERSEFSEPSISILKGQRTCNGTTLERLAKALDMKVSDFIALGEREVTGE